MRISIKYLATIILLCFGFFTMQAQDVYTSSGKSVNQAKKNRKKAQNGFDPGRVIFGGGLGFGFDNQSLSIAVAPIVGYKITDNFSAGIGLGYQYFNQKNYFAIPNYSTNSYDYYPFKASIYSGSVWARYIIWKNLFVHAEYEHNFMSFKNYHQEYDYNTNTVVTKSDNVNYNAPSVLLGAGIRQPIGERFSVVLVALYDVIQDKYSPYKDRIDLRIGFNVGF